MEFLLISVLLVLLLFGVLQVAALFYVRSVTSSAAADGARYGANADVRPSQGSAKASDLIRRGLGPGMANQLPCTAGMQRDGNVTMTVVHCRGRIRSLLLPIGAFVRVDVTARSLKDDP